MKKRNIWAGVSGGGGPAAGGGRWRGGGMKLGISGAGMIGGTLARRLTALGHEVVIANSRGPETLREFAAETGARAVTAAEAARGGEVVIVTIPQRAVPDLPSDLFAGVPEGVVVVDTGNYYPARDGRIEAIEGGQVESAWVAEQLGRPRSEEHTSELQSR